MYYRLKYGKYYLAKIIALVLASVLGEFVIWWALVREDRVEWITGQIIHNPSPYAITRLDDGRTIVGNVLKGFEITLPKDWQVEGSRSVNFYFRKENELLCAVENNISKTEQEAGAGDLLKQTTGFSRIYAGITPAVKKEETKESGDFVYNLQIPVGGDIISYTLLADKSNKNICRPYFEQIRKSFLYY